MGDPWACAVNRCETHGSAIYISTRNPWADHGLAIHTEGRPMGTPRETDARYMGDPWVS